MMHAGASPEEWAHWELVLGLTDDLLPVASEPGLPISPTSSLTTYGKTPSIILPDGVCGLTGWTRRHTTSDQITIWSEDARLGMCLQTRRMRAFDVDISDRDEAMVVWTCLRGWFADHSVPEPPRRVRADSSKFLVLVDLPGDYPKQTLKTATGVIEFLGRGNQCVIAGLHKDGGARYEWEGGLPTVIPEITEAQLRSIQSEIRTRFGTAEWTVGRTTKARDDAATPTGVPDQVVDFLRTHGWERL